MTPQELVVLRKGGVSQRPWGSRTLEVEELPRWAEPGKVLGVGVGLVWGARVGVCIVGVGYMPAWQVHSPLSTPLSFSLQTFGC